MTPEAQRIAIAEACGWKQIASGQWCRDIREGVIWELPDYLSDLNAMHGAEEALFQSRPRYYERAYFLELLQAVTGINPYERGWNGDQRLCCDVVHATAAQRAEAFLRTLNKWEGE